MRAEAIVLSVNENKAKVRSVRQSACASCSGCENKKHCHAMLIFGEQEQSIELEVFNTAGANVGDRVLLASSGANILLLSMLVFVFPVMLSVAAYMLAGVFFEGTIVPVIILAAVFVISFAVCCFLCNKYTERKLKTEIVKIIEESGE